MAAENQGSIYYEVDIETSQLLTGTKAATDSIDAIEKSTKKTDAAVKSLGATSTRTATQIKPLAGAIEKVNAEAVYGATAIGKLSTVLGGLLGIGAAEYVINLAERYGEMAERITMATTGTAEYEMVQKRLLTTAQATYRPLSEAQELFIRSNAALKSLGYTTSQALDITDSLSLAFVKNATSTERASNAIDAYSKVLQKGKIEADAWESITSAIPTIVEDIAKASGKSAAEIRNLGASGTLTARQLNEGLRNSLDENKKAAEGMAVTVKDAFNNLRNSLSVYVGETNKANGSTKIITEAIGLLSNNVETFAKILISVGLGGLTAYVSSLGLQAAAAVRSTLATQAQAVATLNEAKAAAAATAATLAQAQAYSRLGAGMGALTAAQTAHTAALARVAVAEGAVLGAGRLMLGLLGGPIGIIALVATAAAGFVAFGKSAEEAKPPVDLLSESIKDMRKETLALREIQLQEKITQLEGLGGSAKTSAAQVEYLRKQLQEFPNSAKAEEWRKKLIEQEAASAEAGDELTKYKQRLIDVQNALSDTKKAAEKAPEQQSSSTGRTRIKELQDELAETKALGEARAKLKELNKLGDDATPAEKKQVAELAAEIYRLNEAEKLSKKNKEDAATAARDNAKALDELRQKVAALQATGAERGAIQGRNVLNKDATAEEIAQAEQLGRELENLQKLDEQRKKFGTTPVEARNQITGETKPLSGGAFDDQTARYDAEAQAENERYAAQLERLKTAKDLQIEVTGGYQKLEQDMAQQHADRLAQIEQARFQVMTSAGEKGFGALADIAGTFAGKQSGIFKTLFATSKAFNIAQASVNIAGAIAQAANTPFPANLAAMATVAAETANIVSSIQSVSMGGGRLYGGPVAPDRAYRVNENGAPEVFNAANGQQFMIPNTRGEVVSNSRSGGSAAVVNNISISVDSSGTTSVGVGASSDSDSRMLANTIRGVVVDVIERESRQGGIIWRMKTNG